LKAELLMAEDELIQATPENRQEALRRFQEAVSRFSGLVLDDKLPPGWHPRLRLPVLRVLC
jgi:hypothetical protein